MTYVGLVVDHCVSKEVLDQDIGYDSYWLHMASRVKALQTWPGQRIAEDLVCSIC